MYKSSIFLVLVIFRINMCPSRSGIILAPVIYSFRTGIILVPVIFYPCDIKVGC